jgi:citrate lyase gamma subunit
LVLPPLKDVEKRFGREKENILYDLYYRCTLTDNKMAVIKKGEINFYLLLYQCMPIIVFYEQYRGTELE